MSRQLSVDDEDWWDTKPVARFRAGVGGFFSTQWPCFFFAGLCLVFSAIGFFVPAKEGPMVGRTVGIVCLAGAIACIVWGIVRWGSLIKSVDLHEGGVVWQDGGEHRASWDDIKDFYRTEIIINGAVNTRQVVIKTRKGREAVFGFALPNWKRLADRMQQETTDAQLPEAQAAFDDGETIRFGRELAVSRDGLVIKGRTIDNDRIRNLTVRNGYLIVETSGKAGILEVSLGETPNIGVLLALLSGR